MNADELTYVSTGTLPTLDEVRALIASAYERFREESDGNVADYIPALAEVDPALFAICVASTRGDFLAAGEADHHFRHVFHSSASDSRLSEDGEIGTGIT